jgi:hypothetical protein
MIEGRRIGKLLMVACGVFGMTHAHAQVVAGKMEMASGTVKLAWAKGSGGWQLQQLAVQKNKAWVSVPGASGEYTLLFTAQQPDSIAQPLFDARGQQVVFPEPQYRYIIPLWKEAMKPVPMNTAGKAVHFYPAMVQQTKKNEIVFTEEGNEATIKATWSFDPQFAGDVLVRMTLEAKQDGYYSLATPSLAITPKDAFDWAAIPGYFQGHTIQKEFINAYGYGQGIPDKPVVVRERTASTLSPLVTTRGGITMAVIPEPGTSRNPWEGKAKNTDWQLGLSLMNRKGMLTPTLYHPVLGQKGSFLKKGEHVDFSFRYTVQAADWYTVYKHAAEDLYRLKDFLQLKQTNQSLTSRILAMHTYVTDDSTSKWVVEQYKGLPIGAQQYLGGVYGSEKDATKNSDYGAMWMMAGMMNDSLLQHTRLPYARNFKLAQQEQQEGFFKGAAAGQYYLTKSKRFTEEWGPYVEPIAISYYMMMDIGNVLLFNPADTALRKELQRAADRLLLWMKPAGNWAVAYDHATQKELFTDVEDLRPTFYGLLVAYKMLGDQKYLTAARKGADWYIKHAVQEGHFLGVCGDTRFVPDFATGQSVQALLDLYEVTKDRKYEQSAIATAKLYTTSVYTHPIPSKEDKVVNGVHRQDWEISQVGLSFEHGGILGSANHNGPILLASHAGMFVRLFSLTGDSLFLHMARAAAFGRDAFVDRKTSVASYYWEAMNRGAGPYPHHAWWQIGWITDYLLSEAALRSGGNVQFPRGFITPKVGPHQSYGFADGKIYGIPAKLLLKEGLLRVENPYLDYYCAVNTTQQKLYLLLLNDDKAELATAIQMDYTKLLDGKPVTPTGIVLLNRNGSRQRIAATSPLQVSIPAYGIQVVEISYR